MQMRGEEEGEQSWTCTKERGGVRGVKELKGLSRRQVCFRGNRTGRSHCTRQYTSRTTRTKQNVHQTVCVCANMRGEQDGAPVCRTACFHSRV